jgi:hypothetical protein
MESAVEKLIERQKIEDTVVRLFVSTDRRDWSSVKACLADEVTLDMTSLAGGEASPAHRGQGRRDLGEGFEADRSSPSPGR